MQYVVRALTRDDEALLWEMLFQALHNLESGGSHALMRESQFARYVEGWGRPADLGFVAHDPEDDSALGAVWLRVFENDEKQLPHLAFSVRPGLRRQGIGAALLTQLVKATPDISTIIIEANANNPAVRLYERFGFTIEEPTKEFVVMRR